MLYKTDKVSTSIKMIGSENDTKFMCATFYHVGHVAMFYYVGHVAMGCYATLL